MFFEQYHGLFQRWEITYARQIVQQHQRQFPVLQREGLDDLIQECLTHWYFRRDLYDPTRLASLRTFMRRVTENKLKHMIEAKERNIRKAIYNSLPMDMFLIDDEDDLIGCFMIEDENFEEMIHEDLVKTLARAMKKLSNKQKELCHLILDEELNMTQVSKRLNIPRSTLFDEVLRIREIFRQEEVNKDRFPVRR